MKNLRSLLLVLAILIVPAAGYTQGNGKGRPTPTPTPPPSPALTAQFNYCAASDTDCQTANRVRMDVNSPYTNGQQGVSISFNIGVSGDLTINLLTSQRSVVYDLREVAHLGNPHPTWVSQPQNLKVHFNVGAAYSAKSLCADATSDCDVNMVTRMNGGGFTINQVTYRLQWNPTSAQPYINVVEDTSPVNVNYKRDATSEVFTITPLPNADTSRFIAGLQGVGKRSSTFGGQYVMPFALVVRVR